MQLEPITTDTTQSTDQWYVAHCKSNQESQAAVLLEQRLGVSVYLPQVNQQVRGEMRRIPLFTGYLFIHANLQIVAISQINLIPGVLRLVSFGDLPQPVPVAVVDEIRGRLAELNDRGGLPAHNFQPGDILQLQQGPFQGLEAIFLEPTTPGQRVRVLIEFLGSLREVEIGAEQLGHQTAASHPPRRTRGKGRAIQHGRTNRHSSSS